MPYKPSCPTIARDRQNAERSCSIEEQVTGNVGKIGAKKFQLLGILARYPTIQFIVPSGNRGQ
jgi:hypothetical protein